ncbi:MAG TPA: 1-phosphofructokinase family hexose kinase [Dermatophilaceae bacterium]|jgi:1-phosphofructokinase
MIVTLTPAPAIDWTIEVDSFELGAVNRAVRSSREPSGKGVNVSWALHRAGVPTRAVFPAGGCTGKLMARMLTEAGLEHLVVDTGREVRTNITLISPGSATKLNERGAALSEEQSGRLREAIIGASVDASVVLICGSLPARVPASFVRDMVGTLKATGVDVVVDVSGDALELALAARPDLIKPNVHELAELTGRRLGTLGEVADAAEVARERGAGAVLASLGADGALLVDGDGALYAHAAGVPFVNSVGAGDALLAGFFAGGQTRQARLATAMLWASSAVAHGTTLFPIREDLAGRVAVHPLTTPGQPLSEPSAALVRLNGHDDG